MSVYVDAPIWPFGRMMMCHMLADSLDELNDMADRIGVDRKWLQNKYYPHFDICKAKRVLAVKHGAIQIGRQQFVQIARKLASPKTETKNEQ